MDNKDFLGKGMKFPPQINSATGRFVTVSELESVKESIYLILMTQKTERFVRPDFGSELMAYTFMDINITNIQIMCSNIRRDIQKQEPRVTDVNVTADPGVRDGCLVIHVDYLVTDSNTRDNFVFPFYLNAGETVEESEEFAPEEVSIGETYED